MRFAPVCCGNSGNWRRRLPVVAVFGLLPALAFAAPPDAGQILQNIKPPLKATPVPGAALPESESSSAPAASGGAEVTVTAFHITGATAFPDATLQALLADAVGQSLNLSGIKTKVQRITDYYQQHGYLLARAYLPPQRIDAGVVEIRVLEGQLGVVQLDNRSRVADYVIQRELRGLNPGAAVQGHVLERDLLLVNELPGAQVHSTLRPGAGVGQTDLLVRVDPAARTSGNLTYDNDGNRATGSNRLTGALRVNGPTHLGDQLSLQAQVARGVDYGRVSYQLPVGRYATTLGTAASLLHYRLGGAFAAADDHGSADDFTLSLTQPLARSRQGSADASVAVDNKRLHDVANHDASDVKKAITVLTLGISAQGRDNWAGGGVMSGSLSLVDGHLQHRDNVLGRDGMHYDKLQAQWSRLHFIGDKWILSAQLSGQLANRNLDSTEQMPLGGANGVRAYLPGESSADQALLARLELRRSLSADWQAGPFVDAARAQLEKRRSANTVSNGRNLAGDGLVAYYSHGFISAQVFAAWRTGEAPLSAVKGHARAGAQLTVFY